MEWNEDLFSMTKQDGMEDASNELVDLAYALFD